MSDEPKQETGEPSATHELSNTKSLKLQPSAEFAAEQAAQTGPQISLPSSPAPAATPVAAPAPQSTPVPTAAPAADTPPLNVPDLSTPQPAAETPVAQPVVPAAFQTPEQVAAATKEHSHQPPAQPQPFMMTSEMAAAEDEARASATLFEVGTAVLGFASSMSYIGLSYFFNNLWLIGGVCTLLAIAAIVVAFIAYGRSEKVTPLSVVGIAAATVMLVYVGNAVVTYLAFKSAVGGYM